MEEGKLYRPSNGSEGDWFIHKYCFNCIHGKYEHTGDVNDNPCEIAGLTFAFDTRDKEYPKEWCYDKDGKPTCTAFVKFDWERDDDGKWIDPPPQPEPDNPQIKCACHF